MAFQPGYNGYVSIDATDISAYTDQQSLDRAVEMLETTAFGNSDKTYIAGLRGHTFSLSGSWDPTGDGVLIGADDGAVVAFVLGPEGNTSGDIQYSGNALFTNYTASAGVQDKVNWSATFTVTGSVTRGTA